jgi:uncharacterized membrane protein YccC
MSQIAISSNGHRTATRPEPTVTSERRRTVAPESVSPEALIARHVENARRQLAEARENLKASRRRVVQLEDALCNWERFAAELRRVRGNGQNPRTAP